MSYDRTTTATITLQQAVTRSKWRPKICRRRTSSTDGGKLAIAMPSRTPECRRVGHCHHKVLVFLVVYLASLLVACMKHMASVAKTCVRCLCARGERPRLHFKPSALHAYLLDNCTMLTSDYRSTLPGPFGWIQTLSNRWQSFRYREPSSTYRRKLLLTDDGGLVGFDWYSESAPSTKRRRTDDPMLLVVPCGHLLALSEDIVCAHAHRQGFRPVVFRRRGSGGIPLTSPSKFQSFGECSDLREVVRLLRRLKPKARVVAVGIGSGAGLLLSYVGEHGSSCHLAAAVCLSPWYSLERQLSRGRGTFSHWVFLQSLKVELSRSAAYLHGRIDLDRAFGSSSAMEYAGRVMAADREEEFYAENEPLRDIDDIAIPLLCINSLDDPVVDGGHIPFDLFETLPHVMLATTRRGGHGAFLHGWRARNWSVDVALDYCQTVLKVMGRPHLLGVNNK